MMKQRIIYYGVVIAVLTIGYLFIAYAQSADLLLPNEPVFDHLSVDVKVDGSDGPVEITEGSKIVITWESEEASRCKGNWSKNDLPLNGKIAGTIRRSVPDSITVRFSCIDSEGNREDDSVLLTMAHPVASPAPRAPSICYTFVREVNVGSNVHTDELTALGKVFYQEGLYPVPILDPQDFDITLADFQEKYGIKKTGMLDSSTRAKLNGMYGCGTS